MTSPFFIFSSGRSGSSVLVRLLDAHSRLAIPNESHVYRIFHPLLPRYGSLAERRNRERLLSDMLSTSRLRAWDPPPDRQRALARIVDPTFAGIVRAVFEAWAEQCGKRAWGDKTPQHIAYWREIIADFPEARIVHLVRDGRDVALSWVRAPGGPKTVYTAARRWLWYLREVEKLRICVGERRFYQIRYEDLLREPEPTLNRLLAFLGESFEPAMLKARAGAGRHAPDRANRENLEKPLQRGNVERWRTRMTPGQLRLFEAVAAEGLQRHGYELVRAPQKLSAAEHLFRRYVDNPPRKLLAMARNRSAQREAWQLLRLRARLLLSVR